MIIIPQEDFLRLLKEFVGDIEGNYDCSEIEVLLEPINILLGVHGYTTSQQPINDASEKLRIIKENIKKMTENVKNIKNTLENKTKETKGNENGKDQKRKVN